MSNYGNRDSGKRQFTRSRRNRVLGGICASISERMELDVSIVRILVVVLSFITSGTVALIYLIAWIIVPEEPRDTGAYYAPPQPPPPPYQGAGANPPPPPPPQNENFGAQQQAQPGDPFSPEEAYQNRRRRSMLIVGVCLAGAGCLMLAQLLFGNFLNWRYIWPLVIVAIGAGIIIYSGRRN